MRENMRDVLKARLLEFVPNCSVYSLAVLG